MLFTPGMVFFGNILKESGVTRRLADTAKGPLIDIVTILLGFTVGCSTQASTFLTTQSIGIFALGAISFLIALPGVSEDDFDAFLSEVLG